MAGRTCFAVSSVKCEDCLLFPGRLKNAENTEKEKRFERKIGEMVDGEGTLLPAFAGNLRSGRRTTRPGSLHMS